MSHLTRRQHFVPDFYLSQWANHKGQITCHDLIKDSIFTCGPANVLAQSYFYEEDPTAPDNRIEQILSTMESASAPVFKKIAAISGHITSDNGVDTITNSLRGELTEVDLDNLCQFAAYQYLRVPGAMDQKVCELQANAMAEADLVHALNPGRFVESGYVHVKDRFRSMKILIMVSARREFVTSDWPCFDMKDSLASPLLGEEVGKNPEVVCYVPLTPKVSAVFFTPRLLSPFIAHSPPHRRAANRWRHQESEHAGDSASGTVCDCLPGGTIHLQSRRQEEEGSTYQANNGFEAINWWTADACKPDDHSANFFRYPTIAVNQFIQPSV